MPIFELRDGLIVVKSRHHSGHHVSLIPVGELLALLGIEPEALR